MKVVVFGIGQAGCRIADKFYVMNRYARSITSRRIEFVTDGFAANTDKADLSGLRNIPKGTNHRMVIGFDRTSGHGVGAVNQVAFEIIKEHAPDIVNTILASQKFHDADAVLFIASGAGGTGSGSIAALAKELKSRLEADISRTSIYALIVLPFADEEVGEETSFAVTNTASCLSALNEAADAVILIENDRFAKKGVDLIDNIDGINTEIVKHFVDLFCAGEEKNPKKIGAKTLDAGDIKESLAGFTAIGMGEVPLSVWRSLRKSLGGSDYHEGIREDATLTGALKQAMNKLSIQCNLEDARRICYLICAPKDVVTPGIKAEIRRRLARLAPKAEIRGGDYPGRARATTFTLIVSDLIKIDRIEELYTRANFFFKNKQELIDEKIREQQKMNNLTKDFPKLL